MSDFVFGSINRSQASKVFADVRSDFGEIIWYYPLTNGENSRYVSYNYVHDFWMIGFIDRTAGVDRGPLDFPIAADSQGTVYTQESGTVYTDEGGPTLVPFVESGPIQIGRGDNVMSITEIIPDEDMVGEVKANIISAFFPTDSETTSADITLTGKTDIRITARQIRLKLTQITAGWRVGDFRLNVTPGGLR